jgi:peptide-methionine (R)-S-oxide reductase
MRITMTRRDWLGLFSGIGLAAKTAGAAAATPQGKDASGPKVEPLVLTNAQWKERLTPEQYQVLREEGTERPFTSALNDEKRKGTFVCAGCDLPLFRSDMKYESGTGWPSFFTVLPGAVGTRRDLKYGWLRIEYHCARCGGHHGHLFDDGPRPTGMRYCNNGVALKFMPVLA